MLRPALSGLLLALLVGTPGCEKKVKERLYFPDLVPPVGAGKTKVVSDVSLNPAGGGEITVLVAVEPDMDRDELDRVMSTFFRQVEDRRGFQGNGKPRKIDIKFFTSEVAAAAGGDDWLAKVSWTAGQNEPSMENKQKAPLLKWMKEAIGKQPQFVGDIQPRYLADPETMSVELTIPYVKEDGSGEYVDDLSYVKAITEFVAYTRTLFDKLEGLKKLTFVGKYKDEQVLKIWLTRQQYQELDLQQVEEDLGAFQGQFIEPMMNGQIKEKAVEAKVIKQRKKVYGETLALLPEGQVELDKSLK